MSARKFLRVELRSTTYTHLVCVACGHFNVDFAIVTRTVGHDQEGDENAGVHKKCIANVKAKRGVK